MKKRTYNLSIRCFYPGCTEPTKHFQDLQLTEIAKWVEAYKFTHPSCESVVIKVWLNDPDQK